MKGTQRKTTKKKLITIKKRTGSREDEWALSKAHSDADIQSVESATPSEKTD